MSAPAPGRPRTPRARGFRRLAGIDRSGRAPVETRRGQPLRPFTLPNLIGYLRLASLPVFLVLAFESDDGRSTTAALIYLWIALGDYLDGFLARATGQYSRMGALLDPVVDRLTVLAGAVVCWHFELLPRWALLVLAAREITMLVLGRLALRRGIDIEINWVGRVGVFLIFAGIFWSLAIDWWVTVALFLAGVVVAIAATWFYVRAGLRQLRALQPR
ncbi:MAG TPA: CDP-alcohol phosphatidyltransferase family protein [Solirubrobacterales bacterium]|jgi:cardiolipin synthase